MSRLPVLRDSVPVALPTFAALLVMSLSPAWADITTYTDKTEWQDALSGQFFTEDFSDDELNIGVSVTSAEPGGINPSQEYYQDVLTSKSGNAPFTIWSFSPRMLAYGGNWTLGGPGGTGNSLLVYIDNSTDHAGVISNSYGGEFWGFISDTPFTSVKLIGATGSNQQHYQLDDMVYSPVPEPGTLSLLLAGALIGISFAIRRRRNIS